MISLFLFFKENEKNKFRFGDLFGNLPRMNDNRIAYYTFIFPDNSGLRYLQLIQDFQILYLYLLLRNVQ